MNSILSIMAYKNHGSDFLNYYMILYGENRTKKKIKKTKSKVKFVIFNPHLRFLYMFDL